MSEENDLVYVSRLEALLEFASLLKNEREFKSILHTVIEKAGLLFQSDITSIMMINPQTHHTIKTVYSDRSKSGDHKSRMLDSSISGWVIKYKSMLLIRDIKKDERFSKNLLKDTTYHSVLCGPLYAEGMIIGTLLLIRERIGSPFNDQDREYLDKFSTIVSPFMRNVQKIQQFFDIRIADNTLLDKYATVGLIGKCQNFIDLLHAIEIASQSDIRVQIEGESGTGKELVARAIHQFSERSQKKFLALDCGTIPENLIESELFGHVKGAFSGATEHHRGLIQESHEGTLFLDEISNIPLLLQMKLLRFLQEGEVRQIGSNKITKVNVRILSASSKSLYQLVQQKCFREDLFYRLNVYPIKIPSLSKRKEDIPILARYFLTKFAQQHRKKLKYIHEDMIAYLTSYQWGGNIRELENFIEHLVVLAPSDSEILDYEVLPREYRKTVSDQQPAKKKKNVSLFNRVADYEAELIRNTLVENKWNQAQAARTLQISEAAIRYKINKFGIKKPKS